VIDPSCPAQVEAALRSWLGRSLEDPELAFAEPPTRLLGGNRTFVYAFQLACAHAPYTGPLVLRVLRTPRAGDVRLEAALHDALLDQGYPVPCVLAFHEGNEPLGGPFQILERISGGPLLHGYDDPTVVGGGLLRQQLADLRGALIAPWPERLGALQARLHALDTAPIRSALRAAGFAAADLSLARRLEALEEPLELHGVRTLAPAFGWLRERLPACGQPEGLCHGDLFPNQVFGMDGTLCGVLDWSDACFGPPELDVGIVTAGLETLPLLPGPLQALGRVPLRRLSRRFLAAYGRERRIDPERLRFAEAFRCLVTLVSVVERRLARAGVVGEEPAPNPYDRPAGEAALLTRLREITSLRMTIPRACDLNGDP
jgi:aminoglycoside phosphotransferase (APT) family kinase protein